MIDEELGRHLSLLALTPINSFTATDSASHQKVACLRASGAHEHAARLRPAPQARTSARGRPRVGCYSPKIRDEKCEILSTWQKDIFKEAVFQSQRGPHVR